ncbi:MAG TPA: ornithine carbamoyltransferase [Gemmataceae bacterium]|nr:ornithine carbamoyltransferase [Gemmataceae bacterium]
MRHFLSLIDVTADELTHLLDEASHLKADTLRGVRPPLLAGRVLGMIFEKPSLRTRASFESAMAQLGGTSIFLSASDGPIGQRESVADFARTLTYYVDAVVLRTFKHDTIEEFAAHARVPVINGLSDLCHPCQVLGDLLTIQEHFKSGIRGKTLVFVGDGNNVARSLALGCGKLGARFILAAPEGYRFDRDFLQTFQRACKGGELIQNSVPSHAVGEADIIYTDVWTSMGQEAESELRRAKFAAYQVNAELLAQAPPHTRLMHCLPAHRGEEITSDVLDGQRSIVFEQAGNRMHAQKALLKWLLT